MIAPQIVRYAVLARTFSVEELHQVPDAVALWERTQRARRAIVLEEPQERYLTDEAFERIMQLRAAREQPRGTSSVGRSIHERMAAGFEETLRGIRESRTPQDGDGR